MTPDVRVFDDLERLSAGAAEALAAVVADAVGRTGRCAVALSGGSTPRTLYGLLASTYRDRIAWPRLAVFWGDERYVDPEDPRSNYRMARETLLDRVPCPAAGIHPMPTHFPDPDAAARDYEATLKRYFADGPPRFDLVLLGLGDEGHTASLFPGSPALHEQTRWVLPVKAPAAPPRRLTLTLPLLNRAANVYFLVAGAKKAPALTQILSGTADADVYPAAAIRPEAGALVWWVDREAAGDR